MSYLEDNLIRNFNLYYPHYADKVISYREDKDFGLIIKLQNGDTLCYDELSQSLRALPNEASDTETYFRKEFGKRLQRKIYFSGLSQKEVSERTGIQQSALSNYINGKVTPSIYNSRKIAKVVGCSIDELVYMDED